MIKPILRSSPSELTEVEFVEMVRRRNFYEKFRNSEGHGLSHKYKDRVVKNDKVISDGSTALMWQNDGSSEPMKFAIVEKWMEELNQNSFAGHNDWRLPTVEEAMSLIERDKNNVDLYINPIFDKKQSWIWTSDLLKGEPWDWVVDFEYGGCSLAYIYDYANYIRAVRSV